MNPIVLTLRRMRSHDLGTFGFLALPNSNTVLATGELPWRSNKSSISCIPAGTYHAQLAWSWRFLRKLYLLDVPGRSSILIHPANWMGDKTRGFLCQLEGCIALGLRQEKVEGQEGLSHSRQAIELFMASTGGAPLVLNIIDPIPTNAA